MITVTKINLVAIWISVSVGIILYNIVVSNYMTLHEILSAIYFMGIFGVGVVFCSNLKKSARQNKEES